MDATTRTVQGGDGMTREEAIQILSTRDRYGVPCGYTSGYQEALDMAIEALQEPKTIIGIDIPYGSDKGLATIFKGNEKIVLEEVKEIMLVVHCEDCQWRADIIDVDTDEMYHTCGVLGVEVDDEHYCSYGVRKEGE